MVCKYFGSTVISLLIANSLTGSHWPNIQPRTPSTQSHTPLVYEVMKQLDFEVSPPARVMNLNQYMVDVCRAMVHNGSRRCSKKSGTVEVVHNVALTNPDGQTDRRKAMHMSPMCICTGVLKTRSCDQIWLFKEINLVVYQTSSVRCCAAQYCTLLI